jgi:hypothetical protein
MISSASAAPASVIQYTAPVWPRKDNTDVHSLFPIQSACTATPYAVYGCLLLRPCVCCPLLSAICCYPLSHTLRFCCPWPPAFRIRLHSTLPLTRESAATPATRTQPAAATTPNKRATTDPRRAATTCTSRASAETGTGSLFGGTHQSPPPSLYASSASGGTPMTSGAACARASGTDQQMQWRSTEACQQPSSSRTGNSCAWTRTSGAQNAQPKATTTDTSPWVAAATGMALRAAVKQRRHAPLTPLDAATWSNFLSRSGLLSQYPLVVPGISRGFLVGIRSITTNHTPPHTPSLLRDAAAFHAAADKEWSSGVGVGAGVSSNQSARMYTKNETTGVRVTSDLVRGGS